MKIACLGWGSLIWDPRNLLIQKKWFNNGPMLPIEFLRQSEDGRLTLVISKTVKPIRTLWALMDTSDLWEGEQSLIARESPKYKKENSISTVTALGKEEDTIRLDIQNWAISLELDAVIWTNLPPKFNNSELPEMTIEEAILYLNGIADEKRKLAEEYIRRAPTQVDTEFRRMFEKIFDWTPKE